MKQATDGSKSRLIKKYPNRRLYDTSTSAYITLEDVKQLVLDGTDFSVVDSKTKQDVTRGILLQVLLEEESGGVPLFTEDTIKKFIRLYGNAMQGHFGQYMEKSLKTFSDVQNTIQDQARKMMEQNPMLNPEVMANFMTGKTGQLPGSLGSYLAQSAKTLLEMQPALQQQAEQFFKATPMTGMDWFGLNPKEKKPDDTDGKK